MVEDIWSMYMKRNMQVTGYVFTYMWSNNNSKFYGYFIRNTAAVNEDDDGEMKDGEDDNLDNDGDDVSGDEEMEEEV